MPEPERPRRRWWTWCLLSARWTRISALAACLVVLLVLTWLRVFGLPGFLRVRLVRELADRGIVANFHSLKFHWFRGLVAEDLRVSWGGPGGPRITLAEADLDIDPPPWSDGRLIRGLAIRDGSLVMPLLASNEPPLELRVERIAADLRFEAGDSWHVRRLAADVEGLQLELQARITNTAQLRRGDSDPVRRQRQLARLRAALEEVQTWIFISPARLQAEIHLDGARPDAVRGDLYLHAPDVRTPRGNLENFRFSSRLQPQPAADGSVTTAQVSSILEAGEIQTADGGMSDVSLRIDATGPTASAFPTNANWRASIQHLFVRGFRARNLEAEGAHHVALNDDANPTNLAPEQLPWTSSVALKAASAEVGSPSAQPVTARELAARIESVHALKLALPVSLDLDLHSEALKHAQFSTAGVRAGARLRRSEAVLPEDAAPLSHWRRAWPFEGPIELAVTNFVSPRLEIASAQFAARWSPPRLDIASLNAALYRGRLQTSGQLDVLTREAVVEINSTFDLHGIDELLGPRSRENFERYQWDEPPAFQGRARAILPAWNDPVPDWREVKNTVRLDGRFQVEHGSFKTIAFDRAASSISYDGQSWRLPDLHAERPEGTQEIAVDYNEDTREYQIDARGRVFPHALKPVLGDATSEVLDLFEFKAPVEADVTVWGPWTEGARMGILGELNAGALSFRDQDFDALTARLHYTNRVLLASGFRIARGPETVTGDAAQYDFATDTLRITNVVSTMTPAVVAAALSPEFPERIAHYRFDAPPVVRANGMIRPRARNDADLVFEVQGGGFHFWRLSAERIGARVHWLDGALSVDDIDAAFYGGVLQGAATFDVSDREDTPYHFRARVREASLAPLLREATPGSQSVAQGIFDLDLEIDSARASDIRTWNGRGQAELRDGLLWDVPIFGFLSPVLNSIVPGIGNNRAERASAAFTITNGVVHTRDLMIACPPARLLYRGTIDFDQHVDAKVEAQVLSDIVGVGPIFGLLLRPLTKLLEFRVTGTLADVSAEPLYIPKFLLMPLRPMKTIKELFNREAEQLPSTNTPAPGTGPLNSSPAPPQ